LGERHCKSLQTGIDAIMSGVRVRVHKYIDGSLAVFHGPRKLADYDTQGKLKENKNGKEKAA